MTREHLIRTPWIVTIAVLCSVAGCEDDCEDLRDGAQLCGEKATFLTLEDPYPIVKASLNGKPLNLLLDTGVGYSEDSSAWGYVSATWMGVSEGGIQVDSICLGEMCFRDLLMYAMDTPLSDPHPGSVNGTLGMGLLRFFNIEFDRMKTVTLYSQTQKISSFDCGSVPRPILYGEYGVPLAHATADGLDLGDILLDTGAYYTLLDQSTVDALGDYVRERAIEEGGCSFDGCVADGKFVSALRQYCVYDDCVEDLEIKFPVWNVIGSSFFKNFRVIFRFDSNDLTFCRD